MAVQTVHARDVARRDDARTAQVPAERTDADLLVAASVLLADAALAARRTGAELTAAGSSWRVGLQAVRRPAWAFGAALSAARAVTNPAGLGFAANGGVVGEAVRSSAPSPAAGPPPWRWPSTRSRCASRPPPASTRT